LTILPDHTVSIDDIGFFAENPDVSEPFKRYKYDMVELDSGTPRHYQIGIQLRSMNFTTTITGIGYTNSLEDVLEMLKKCIGIHLFTSRYIGSFTALINIKLNGFTPDSVKAAFTVEEISKIEKTE
jgi:hypothetical protein